MVAAAFLYRHYRLNALALHWLSMLEEALLMIRKTPIVCEMLRQG